MKNNGFVKYILIICIVVAVLLAIFKTKMYYADKRLAKAINNSIQTDLEDGYKIVQKLTTGVQKSYFDDLLGKPVFAEPNSYYTYVHANYFVHITTGDNDNVTSFAVTSRSDNFQPTFELKGLYKVQLNVTPFSEWTVNSSSPLLCFHFQGAHDPQQYFEQSFFGNAGNYQSFSVGVSNAGNFDGMPSVKFISDDDIGGLGKTDCKRIPDEDRSSFKPNTFVVTGKGINAGTWLNIGPDPLQTRLLIY